MRTALTPRLALGLALAITAATGVAAHAEKAPRTSDKSATFFLRQEGCGATAEAGRLEPKSGSDGATGCGTIGGLPINEALGSDLDPYVTTGKGLPITVDATRKVTGQLAAGSWVGVGTGGAGTVTFDVALSGTTASGVKVTFGEKTVSAPASPGQDVVLVPFDFVVPATANNVTLTKLTLEILQRGMNVGMSAQQLDGDSYVVIPTRPAPKKKK